MWRRLDLDFVFSTKRKISFYPLCLIILLCFKRQLRLGISSFLHRKQYGPRARHFTAYTRVPLYPDNYRQHCAQRKAPVFKLLRGRFWGFSPRRGDMLQRWWWNLAWRNGPSPAVHSSMPNFTPVGATTRVQDPKTENFTKFLNINAPQGRIPCVISRNLQFVSRFKMR